MTTYRYKGMTSSGAEVEGLVEAFDKNDAVVKAKENCRVLVSVEPVSSGKMNDILNADIGDLFSGGKIKAKTLTLLCSQLSIELRAGLPLVSALKLVAENEEDKKLKKILTEVADDVHAGNGLADAFATRGPALPRTFIETVRAGEESGKLDETFARLQNYYEKSAAVGSKVASAMVYPAMLIAVAILVVGIIMVVAVPVFEDSFASMGNELPALQTVGGGHGDAANHIVTNVLGNLGDDGTVAGGDLNGVEQHGQLVITKANIKDGTHDLDHGSFVVGHGDSTPFVSCKMRNAKCKMKWEFIV